MDRNNITFLPVTTGFLVLLIIQRIILSVCTTAHVQIMLTNSMTLNVAMVAWLDNVTV